MKTLGSFIHISFLLGILGGLTILGYLGIGRSYFDGIFAKMAYATDTTCTQSNTEACGNTTGTSGCCGNSDCGTGTGGSTGGDDGGGGDGSGGGEGGGGGGDCGACGAAP